VTVVAAGADRHRDDDELGVRDCLGERIGRLESGSRPDRRIEIPARHAPHAGPARRPPDRGADEPRSNHREPLERGRGRLRRRLRRPRLAPRFALRQVEHGGEKCLHTGLCERPAVRVDELSNECRLALGVDDRRPGRFLVLVDTKNELEAAVQGREQGTIDRLDLASKVLEIAHSPRFCTVSALIRPALPLESRATRTPRRFSACQ
jgi:hypothetical protein